MQKRVVRVVSYEGNPSWVDKTLQRTTRTIFNKQGTIKELQCVELKEGERLRVVVEREE